MLAHCLSAVITGEASDDILDWYAYERRRCFLEIVNPSAIEFKRRAQEADPARRRADETNFRAMQDNRDAMRAALVSNFALCSRPYRPDWRETLLVEDQRRGSAGQTLILGAHSTARITRDID